MKKPIHIHTADAPGWSESKHPRKDNGEFGSGHGQRHAPSGRSFGERGKAAAAPKSNTEAYLNAPANAKKHAELAKTTKDPAQPKTHTLVKMGKSIVGIPNSQLHASHEEAKAAFG